MNRGLALGIAFLALALWSGVGAARLTVPQGLSDEVGFWKRVYTDVDTDGGLIHDSRHLAVVYEAVEFPDGVRSRRARQHYVDRIKARYRRILARLAKGPRDGLSDEERRVLALWPEAVSARTLRAARHHIRFQLGQRDKFRGGLIRSGAWEPHIRRTLKAMGLPEELAALPHVESSFNPRARSHVGAAGLWQFTRSTGRRYMRIDHVVDERMDPYLSTVAAARLLKHNYAVLGSWPLAITAYNHGAAGMRRAVQEVGTDDIVRIVHDYDSPTFGFASRNFYAAFLAAAELDFNAGQYFGDLRRDQPVSTASFAVPAYVTASTLADVLGVGEDVLRTYNPALQEPVWQATKRVPKDFEMRVPWDRSGSAPAVLLANLGGDQRYAAQIPDRFHTVRRGQTLSSIAARYGVRTSRLVALNDLRSRNFIRAGQVLRLPGAESAAHTAQAEPAEPDAIPESGVYTVSRGDSLWEIAKRFDLPVSELAALNSLDDRDRLRIGQTIRLTAPEEPQSPQEPDGETILASADASDLDLASAVLEQAPPQAESVVEEADQGAVPVETQPQLSADPADYEVSADATIEVQAAETLGHYADWLQIRTQRLRDINGLRFGRPVVIGQRLKLQFTDVDRSEFVRRRVAYHRRLQGQFFQAFRITGSEDYAVERGDSLWLLARRAEHVPLWLLRQYNPDLDFSSLKPGMVVTLPQVRERQNDGDAPPAGEGPIQQASLDE